MVLPSSYIGPRSAHAFNQIVASTNWLPFGPYSDKIIFSYYSDFSTMFSTFTTGGPNGIDVTDWPMFPNQQAALCNASTNPDFFCGSQQASFGLDQVDINHHSNFLGVAQLASRVTAAVTASISSSAAGCSTGFGSVTVTLKNQERTAAGVDPEQKFNNMTLIQVLSGGVFGSAMIVSGLTGFNAGTPGVYLFPCVVAGNYLLANNAYANCPTNAACTVLIGSATSNQVTFLSNWGSPSTVQYTVAGTLTRMAIAELLNKPQYIIGGPLQGNGICTDIYAAQPQGFPAGFCSTGGIVNPQLQPAPDDVLTRYCKYITQSETAQGIPAASQLNCAALVTTIKGSSPSKGAYLLNSTAIGSTQVWWGATGSNTGSTDGYPSKQDVRAACDLLVQAGFTLTPSGSTCISVANAAQGPTAKTTYAHIAFPTGKQIIAYIRNDPLREAYGQIVVDALNFLFGTANNGAANGSCAVSYGVNGGPNGCSPAYYGFNAVSNIIFSDGQNPDTWNIYTGAEGVGVTPDNLYGVGNSLFASNQCGGTASTVISNYEFSCDPRLDMLTNVGEFQDTSQGAAIGFRHEVNIYQNASYVGVEDVQSVPVFNQLQRFVALNCLNLEGGTIQPNEGSLVNGFGTGWLAGGIGAYFTYLNAHPNPNYTPTNPSYACEQGNARTLRVGQSQDSDSFSPFQAASVWDFNIMNELWDSMLAVNPETGGQTLQFFNWMISKYTSTFQPSEASCSPGQGCVTGTTTQAWHLRPDLQWQDGTPVTADDVCFSILSYRDMPAALLQSSVINVASCTAINSSIAQVKLTLGGPNDDILVGSVPIIPHKYWAIPCNWPVGSPEPAVSTLQSSQCDSGTFDPMASGIMVGDGPFECLAVPGTPNPGAPGGPCSQTGNGLPGGQLVTRGGRIVLTASPSFERGPIASQGSKYQKFSWADKFDQGLVTIADLADAARVFKHYDAYWSHPDYSSTATCSATGGPGTGNLQCVDIGVIATIASYIGTGALDPVSLGTAVGLDPHIDLYDGVIAPSNVFASAGGYFLASTQTSPTTTQLSLYGDNSIANPVTSVSAQAETSGGAIVTGTCSTTGFIAPDGPGRATYTCTFTSAVVEIDYRLTFLNGVVTHVLVGQRPALAVGFNYSPLFPVPGQSITFTADTVTGGTAPYTYTWDFGDGTAGVDATASHAYTSEGGYTVTLTIADSKGLMGYASNGVSVQDFRVGFSCAISGLTETCTAGAGSGGGQNLPVSFSWDFGGMGSGTGLSGPNATFTYSAPGTYSVTVTATDNTGNTATATNSITVPFTVDFTCTNSGLTASCAASTNGGNPPFSFRWNFGGAGAGTGLGGPNPTFTYSAPGTYLVTLTATGATSNTATITHAVTV